MKITFEDVISRFFTDLIIANINICIDKLNSKNLDDEDYDMIITHLDYYKNLLLEVKNNE